MTTPERQERSRANGRMPVNCSRHLTLSGNSYMLTELGANSQHIPSIFLWCRQCRKAHALTLSQMLHVFEDMSLLDQAMRQQYVSILSSALSEVQKSQPESRRNEAS